MIKKITYTFLATMFGIALNAEAQSLSGVTHIRDTSYSTYSAFKNSKQTNPETEWIAPFQLPDVREKKDVAYCSIGKRNLKLDVFSLSKKSAQKRTAIIIIHGGGWRTGDRSQHHQLAQKLAALGYVCFTPEYRLSTEALFPAAIYDLKAVIRWVRKNANVYNIDTSKITALGFSAGGEMATFLGTTINMPLFEGTNCNTEFSSNVNAVVDIDGTLSFVHPDGREGDDSKGISSGSYWFGYSKKENLKLWEAASPLSYVGTKTPPTLFVNSSVSWMHAGREDYIQVLNQHNIYSEVHSFPNAPHSFCLFEPWFTPTVKYIDDFLIKVFNPQK